MSQFPGNPVRNGPTVAGAPPSNPASSSNAAMMRGATTEQYSGGRIARQLPAIQADSRPDWFSGGARVKNAVVTMLSKIASAQLALEADKLVGTPLPLFKLAAEREPQPEATDLAQQLRPRAEVIIAGKDGDTPYVWAIDKGSYLLLPGGGISDGEQPRDAGVRETLEESRRNVVHLEPLETVSAIWPPDAPFAAAGFDGERSYFFGAIDAGESGMTHTDNESFTKMPVPDILRRLDELITDEDEHWAVRNNEARRDGISKMVDLLEKPGFGVKKLAAAASVIPKLSGIPLKPAQKFVNDLARDHASPTSAAATPAAAAPAPATKTAQSLGYGANPAFNVPPAPKTAPIAPTVTPDESGLVPGYAHSRLMPEVNSNSLIQAQADSDKEFARDQAYQEKVRQSTQRRPALPHQAKLLKKQGDAAVLQPRQEHVLFTPDGKIVLRRGENRRFQFPTEGRGRPAPYEDPVTYVPEEGVPDEGVHGYRIGMHVGDSNELPEGYESEDPESVLKELYASMGLAKNKPFRGIDRARARVLLRALKTRKPKAPPAEAAAPQAPSAPIVTNGTIANADGMSATAAV